MSLSLSIPASLYVAGSPTRAITATLSTSYTSATALTLNDNGAGGTFYPTSPSIPPEVTSIQFAYVPAPGATGTITLTATGSGGQSSLSIIPGTPVTLFSDTFAGADGTNLTTHTSTSGGAWATGWNPGGSSILLTGANTVRPNGGNGEVDASVAPAANSDLDVVATDKVFDFANGQLALMARSSANGALNAYLFFYNGPSPQGWYLRCYYNNGGSTTDLIAASTLTPQPATGGVRRLAVRSINSQQTLFCLYNGALIVPPIQDNTLTSGSVGLTALVSGTPADTAGQQLSSFALTTAPVPPPIVVAFPNANLFQSPGSFLSSGSAIISPTGGGYIKGAFLGSATLALGIDTSSNASLATSDMPCFRVIVDSNPAAYYQAAAGATKISLGTGLSTGPHTFRIDVIGANFGNANAWSSTAGQTRITSIILDAGATLSAPTLRPKRAMLFGDSYLQAYFGQTVTGVYYNYVDFTRSLGPQLAFGFNVELGQQGIGGSGWVQPGGDGYFPAFPGWWNQYDSTHPRVFPTLDYLFICHGINDHSQAPAAVQAAVTAWLPQARAALPVTTIFVCIPPNGCQRAAITAGFLAGADGNMHLIDVGNELVSAVPLNAAGTDFVKAPTYASLDGIHLTDEYQAWLGNAIARNAQVALASGGGPFGGFFF